MIPSNQQQDLSFQVRRRRPQLLTFVSADNEIMDARRSQSQARPTTAGRYSDLFQPQVHNIGYLITQTGWQIILGIEFVLMRYEKKTQLILNCFWPKWIELDHYGSTLLCICESETVWNCDWNDSALIISTRSLKTEPRYHTTGKGVQFT